jgi:drug/metabolite transporter (DMT)-like permease
MKRHQSVGRPLDAVATALMVVLCLSWGLNQVAIKLALPEIPPMTQGALRSFGALPVVLIIALHGIPLTARDGPLAAGLLAGALFGLEFICIYAGLVWTTASRGVVFVYVGPFFIALGARLFLHERLVPLQWGGLALAFLGIVVFAVGVPDPTVDGRVLLGDCLLIAGGMFWAATTLIIKGTSLARVSAEKTTIYQLAMSALLLAVGAAVLGERVTRMPGAVALGSLAYQTIWVLAITFTVWFALVVRYSASRLAALSFLTPLFGVAAGHFILGDPLTPSFVVAVVLVVIGLVLVNRPR